MKPDYGPFNDPLKGIPRNPNQQPIRDFPKNVPWRLNPNEKKWPPTHPSPLDDAPLNVHDKLNNLIYTKCSIEEATHLKNLKTNKLYLKSPQRTDKNTFKVVKNEVWVSEGLSLICAININDINYSVYEPLKDRFKNINLEGNIISTDYDSINFTTKITIVVNGNHVGLDLSTDKVKITSLD
jgi:hypothetical protein